MKHVAILYLLAAAFLSHSLAYAEEQPDATKWEDNFDEFSHDRWTSETSGLKLFDPPPTRGVHANNGVATLLEPLRGIRLTSRDRFLYGTLEARVRISPKGLQYIGFMSRSPWGANNVTCMSIPTGNGWEMVLARDRKGGHAGFGKSVAVGQWAVLRIDWQPDAITLDVDGKRIGQITDAKRIPTTPLPLILDTYTANRFELDYLRVTATTIVRSTAGEPPKIGTVKNRVELASPHWHLEIDDDTGVASQLTQRFPETQRWTPPGAAAVDISVRAVDAKEPIRFERSGVRIESTAESRRYTMRPLDDAWRRRVAANVQYEIVGDDLVISADFQALENIAEPVEIGLGVPFTAAQWQRNAIPRLPWLALAPDQPSPVRLPFLDDPDDATVPTQTGNWVHYPFGILQNASSSVFWGGMDIGQRIVLSPGNQGSGPAVTLAPKTWAKGQSKRLTLRLRAFPRCTTEVVRWYLSHCVSSDPLTKDLFPVKDWTPRTLPGGGGLGMPDFRISRVNGEADPAYFDRATRMLQRYHVTNLWFGVFHHIDGSYPTEGEWLTPVGLKVSAPSIRDEVARLQRLGLRPCLYTYQFVTPEILSSNATPSRDWVLRTTLGDISKFDTYRAGEERSAASWFTSELANQVGSNVLTWANVDYGRKEVRDFYFESITRAIDYYKPSGICFDYGWGVSATNATYSPANPQTSQPHARLRVQADIARWMHQRYPEMVVLINDNPGTPSQLFANCQLVESSDVMSDLDIESGRALASAMSSMDYFADHDEGRWSRQVMTDLSRGCSIGLPFWIPMNGPDDYVNTWQTFYDFSAKTTALPIVPDSRAVSSDVGPSVKGTVWSNGTRVLAAAMDHRTAGEERSTTLTIRVPPMSHKKNWRLTKLSNRVQPVNDHGWTVTEAAGTEMRLRGPLRPGEMILVE